MITETTLAIIKPDAIKDGHAESIIKIILNNGFTILEKKNLQLTKEEAENFYIEHKDRSFFDELVTFMISGNIIVMKLQHDNAVIKWRTLMGETNPAKAADGTVRNLYGTSIGCNATHGSDSLQSAIREVAFFFN